MPKRTVYAYTVLLYIYMKQDAPIPGPVFLYMYLYYLVNTPPRILFSRHLSADMHDGRKTSCKVRNHQLDRIHDFHLLTFYDNFTIA